jgi:hypothetical protein
MSLADEKRKYSKLFTTGRGIGNKKRSMAWHLLLCGAIKKFRLKFTHCHALMFGLVIAQQGFY